MEIIKNAYKENRTILTEVESKQLLSDIGILVVETKLAVNMDEAVSLCNRAGYPVALKIVSPDITHKSDSGGIRLGLENEKQVEKAYEEIMTAVKNTRPDAVIQGVSIQKMVENGVEVIMGLSRDALFGPVLMFGLGGVFVEMLKDVAFGIVPLLKCDARRMIKELKGYPLLKGYRGNSASDIDALEDMLMKLSGFANNFPEIKELDLNPVFALKDGAIAADARVILTSK